MANEIFDKTYKLPTKYVSSMKKRINQSNYIIISTSWNEFKEKEKLFENK